MAVALPALSRLQHDSAAFRNGPVSLAQSYETAQYAIFIPLLLYAYRDTSITLKDFLTAILRPAIASAVAALGILGIPVLELPVSVAGFTAFCLVI